MIITAITALIVILCGFVGYFLMNHTKTTVAFGVVIGGSIGCYLLHTGQTDIITHILFGVIGVAIIETLAESWLYSIVSKNKSRLLEKIKDGISFCIMGALLFGSCILLGTMLYHFRKVVFVIIVFVLAGILMMITDGDGGAKRP